MLKSRLTRMLEILRRRRRRHSGAAIDARGSVATQTTLIPRRRAIAIADAIEAATHSGADTRAERLIDWCVQRHIHDPHIVAAIARRRLSQGRPESALRVIETASVRTADLRLLRAAVMIELGRSTEAHADLHEWSRSGVMPDAGRVLLADLAWSTGGPAHAMRTIEPPTNSLVFRAMHLLARIAAGADQASCRESAVALQVESHGTSNEQSVAGLLGCLALATPSGAIPPSDSSVEALTREIALAPDVLPLLAAAQTVAPKMKTIRLLVKATERALERMPDASAALDTLARLCMLIDDRGAALHWARQALDANPMSAPMALLLREAGEHEGRADGSIPFATPDDGSEERRRAA